MIYYGDTRGSVRIYYIVGSDLTNHFFYWDCKTYRMIKATPSKRLRSCACHTHNISIATARKITSHLFSVPPSSYMSQVCCHNHTHPPSYYPGAHIDLYIKNRNKKAQHTSTARAVGICGEQEGRTCESARVVQPCLSHLYAGSYVSLSLMAKGSGGRSKYTCAAAMRFWMRELKGTHVPTASAHPV
jgi:hypothetical protein